MLAGSVQERVETRSVGTDWTKPALLDIIEAASLWAAAGELAKAQRLRDLAERCRKLDFGLKTWDVPPEPYLWARWESRKP